MRYYLPCRHSRVDACYWHSRLFEQQTLKKIPAEGSGFPKSSHAPTCDWALEKCVKKVQATLNKAESPATRTSRNNNSLKCTSAKFACLVKRNCPAGDARLHQT